MPDPYVARETEWIPFLVNECGCDVFMCDCGAIFIDGTRGKVDGLCRHTFVVGSTNDLSLGDVSTQEHTCVGGAMISTSRVV